MDDICKLITKTMTQDALGYPVATEAEYETFCSVDSITRAEFFNAGKAGITPELVFRVNAVEYSGQELIEYDGKRYGIYRTYKDDSDMIELYAEYKSGVTDYTPAEEVSENASDNQSESASEHNTEHAQSDSSTGR